MVESRLQFIDNYWVRPLFGKSVNLVRLKSLEHQPMSERFIAALLRNDGEAAGKILQEPISSNFRQQITESGPARQLIALIHQRVCDLGLAECLDDHAGGGLVDGLRAQAAAAMLRFPVYDALFVKMVDSFRNWNQDVVWLKGTGLSRSLYKQPHFRISVDFDLLLPSNFEQTLSRLQAEGFSVVWDELGHSYQLGVGPVGSLKDLMLAPSSEFEPFHDLTLWREGWPFVELKSDPWNRGLKAKERERFFADCQAVMWQGRHFLAPDVVDHLILQLVHYHKHGFWGWHWLYDIHLLVDKISETPELWAEFVRRCRLEQADISAWAGLELARDRLSSSVPAEVLAQLAPEQRNTIAKGVTFTVNPEFVWNLESLPVLLLNAAFLGDRQRKLRVLSQCLFPDKQFLSDYYAAGRKLRWWQFPFILIIHWLVLLLPAGAVRLTFGQWFWPLSSIGNGRE